MKQPPRQRTIKDERDENIGKDAKVNAFEWLIAITQVLTMMCIIQGNPAWHRTNIDIIIRRSFFTDYINFRRHLSTPACNYDLL
jgi:hypothetical protein